MIPLRKNMKQMFKTIVIHFDKKKKYVTKVELLEKNGDKTIIELQNISINEAISASLFNIR
jgi:outer membrane lipoprotein carrier protein